MQLQSGTRLTVTIEDIAFGGEGVARIDGFVVFVSFVIPREVVEVELYEVKKSFARAKLIRVISPSPQRVTPECRYFATCGGCQYQHISYPFQLAYKRKQAADLFERIGGFDPNLVKPVLPCPAPYGYRNRIMVRSQWNKPEQKLNIGFIQHDCGLVVDIEECKIAEPEVSAMIRDVRDNPPPRGGLKVVLRLPPEGWELPADSFFQNNFHMLPGLLNTVKSMLQQSGSRHLLDVYCGVGFFGIELAAEVESFAGLEYDAQAIKAARKNAVLHSVQNGEFVAGKAEELLPELLAKFSPEKTTALLDPPRKGCLPQTIKSLRELRPQQIIYVSCHPATMARDLKLLCDGTFQLHEVALLDMFPQTQHMECVADIRLVDSPSTPPHSNSED